MTAARFIHPQHSRRTMLQAGSIGLLGLGMNHLAGLREAVAASSTTPPAGKARSCIYIFLSGGLAQHDSFDPKPDAAETSAASSSRSPPRRPASRFASICRCWRSAAIGGPWFVR